MVITRTHIGCGSPKQDTEKAHGEPLGKENVLDHEEELRLAEHRAVLRARRSARALAKDEGAWRAAARRMERQVERLCERVSRPMPRSSSAVSPASVVAGWAAKIPTFTKENGNVASRAAFGAVLNATADSIPELVGGSADLTPSNNTSVKAWKNFTPSDYTAPLRPFRHSRTWNGRHHERHGACTGACMPYGGTFLIFSDYMRPAIRLACDHARAA